MLVALAMVVIYLVFLWLVFAKLKWLKFSITWGVVSFWVGLHLFLVFIVGLRFITPYSTDARVIQHTIQLIPRLPEPTLVTAVLVQPDVPVKKGDPLFQFDKRPYQDKVNQLAAQLAGAKQNVHVLKADVEVAQQKIAAAQSELEYARYQQQMNQSLADKGAGPKEDAQKWAAQAKVAEAGVREAQAELQRAQLRFESEINGVNTSVAEVQAQLSLAQYYLDNTTMVAPADGHIINLQVRAGMVSGIIRFGAIASFIVDADRYVLASYWQEQLKFVKPGQEAEFAFDLYPGGIVKGHVDSIWWGTGEGQLLPSGDIPKFTVAPPNMPQTLFAVKLLIDEPDPELFPIGAQGTAAIYTSHGGWAAMRKIAIRSRTWLNWLYPVPF